MERVSRRWRRVALSVPADSLEVDVGAAEADEVLAMRARAQPLCKQRPGVRFVDDGLPPLQPVTDRVAAAIGGRRFVSVRFDVATRHTTTPVASLLWPEVASVLAAARK